MEDHLQSAMDKSDLAAIAAGLASATRLVPDASWNTGAQGWSTIANAGAAAAKQGDMAATKQACKTCHKTWRSKYKESFRLRRLPD
jgi:hypothetical protein